MNDGTFTIVPLPQGVTFMDVDFDSISELGGELCYTQRTSGTAYNIWTLQLPGDEEEEGHRWSLRWRVDFRRRVGVVLPLAVSDDGGTLTVYEHRVGIHRLDGGRESHPEKVVDMAAVTRGLVGQWIAGYGCARQCGGSGDHDREQCDGGGAAHDRMQCGDGDYYCERCGGDGDYCERCGADDEDDWEQCGGDDGDGDGDGDGVGEPLGLGQGDHGDHDGDEYDDGYDYDGEEEYWYLQGGRYKPLRPALRSLFAYVPSLVKID
nr:F-box domain-containing protein [Oryza sativa Japonica Group]